MSTAAHTERVRVHGNPVTGFLTGLLLGIGLTLLAHQFDLWPFTLESAILFPIAIALVTALRAWFGASYRIVAEDESPPVADPNV